jgi:hypothetical protein
VIAGVAQFQEVMWAVNGAVSVLLLVLLVIRKNYKSYQAFTLYIFINLILGAWLLVIYRRWGFGSMVAWLLSWGLQIFVTTARGLAVAELCSHFLSRYLGVWTFAKRILIWCVGLVLAYSALMGKHRWELAVPSIDRGLELSIAAVIVTLFFFVRYYEVQIGAMDRSLAIGLCLYSCFRALNDTLLERYLRSYATFWSVLGTIAFFASLLLWAWAFRKEQSWETPEENLLAPGAYQEFNPQVNMRLRLLNEHLSKILRREVTRH